MNEEISHIFLIFIHQAVPKASTGAPWISYARAPPRRLLPSVLRDLRRQRKAG